MSRFDSLDRLLTHDDNFRELLTILTGDTSGHLNRTSADIPFAGGGDDDVAGEAGSDMLDGGRGNDMSWGGSCNANWATSHNSLLPVTFDKDDGSGNIATAYGAGIGGEQHDHFSLLHMIESMHGLPPLDQSASAPPTTFASTTGESGSGTGETHVASPPTVPDPPPVTDPAPADPMPATPKTLSADLANLDAGHWAMNSTWSGILVKSKDFTQSIPMDKPNSPSARRNMRQWINTLPQQHFTDANGMQWTIAENKSRKSPMVLFVPSKFLGPGQHRD